MYILLYVFYINICINYYIKIYINIFHFPIDNIYITIYNTLYKGNKKSGCHSTKASNRTNQKKGSPIITQGKGKKQ